MSRPQYVQWLGVQRLWLHASWVELPRAGAPLELCAPYGPEWDALPKHAP